MKFRIQGDESASASKFIHFSPFFLRASPNSLLFSISQVFGSHVGWKHTSMCTWDSEYGDGYFQVDQNILGDFAIVCKFGGQLANSKDKSTVIFKYQNTTGECRFILFFIFISTFLPDIFVSLDSLFMSMARM